MTISQSRLRIVRFSVWFGRGYIAADFGVVITRFIGVRLSVDVPVDCVVNFAAATEFSLCAYPESAKQTLRGHRVRAKPNAIRMPLESQLRTEPATLCPSNHVR